MSLDSEEHIKPKLVKGMTKTEYHRKYMREWARRSKDFNIKPTQTTKFKVYYDEYVTIKQRNFEPIVKFTEFILQFCEIGFLQWKDKNK